MSMTHHDAYRHKTSQNVGWNASGGSSTQSVAFGSQTYAIRVVAVGVVGATDNGARIQVGDNPTANSTSPMLPYNWIETIRCTPGQKIAVVGNTSVTGSLNVTELTD